jgi:hypothetical protein
VRLAEVIAVRLDLVCERPENRRGIPIGIGQCRRGRIGASCSRTATRPHLPDATPQATSIVGSAAVSESASEPSNQIRIARRRAEEERGDTFLVPE